MPKPSRWESASLASVRHSILSILSIPNSPLTPNPGHSWSPVFGRSQKHNNKNNGDILISTLGLIDATILPNFTSLPTDLFQPEAKDLNSIIFVDHSYVKGPQLSNGKRYVRVGTSTTNEQLRKWCINTGKVTLPCQIIEVEITMGGSNATIWYVSRSQPA